METMETVGERVAFFRHKKKMTQETLAIDAGIHQSSLSDIENDRVSPNVKTLKTIAKVLEIPTAILIPEAGNVFNNEANDSANNINYYYGSFEEERKT